MNFWQRVKQVGRSLKEYLGQTFSDHSKFFEDVCIARLAELIKSTGNFTEAYVLLLSLYSKKPIAQQLQKCDAMMKAGVPFSGTILINFPTVSPIAIELIRVGEKNGALPQVLSLLSTYIEEKRNVRSTVVMACLYPMLLIFAMTFIIGFLVIYIFPKMLSVLQGMNIKLPVITQLLIGLITFLQHYWFHLLVVLILGCVIIPVALKQQKVRKWIQKITLDIKLLNTFIKLIHTILVFRVLAVFLETDSRLVNALQTAATVVRYANYKEGLHIMSNQVREGQALSMVVRNFPDLFTDETYEFVVIGERGGRLAYICDRIAVSAHETLTKKIKMLLKLAEPMLMLVMGGTVTFIALSFMLPLYSITGSLGK